jgi:SAM-dependent methyltransferase
MDIASYAAETAIEADHCWFVGRRLLFSDIIRRFDFSRNIEILDVGTGTGSNLRLLRDLGFTRVTGVDQSPDLILATDVIEHVEDDLLALRELCRVLKPRQTLLLTVPAFPLLWGLQDTVSHHKRRYRLDQLLERLHTANLSPQQHFYFNYILFLPILICRRLMRIFNIVVASEGQINTDWLNRALALLFRFDVRTAPWVRPPFGVSALVIATRH